MGKQGRKNKKGKSNFYRTKDGVKVNTFGGEIVSHENIINEEFEKYSQMVDAIENYLCGPPELPEEWREKKFMYLAFVPYCSDEKGELVPAEFSAVVWSFEDGLVESFSALLDPGYVPFGELYEVRTSCEDNGLPFPGKFEESGASGMNAKQFFAKINELAEKHGTFLENEILVFTMKGDLAGITCCLKWLERKAEEHSPRGFKVFLFETLLKCCSWKSGHDEDTPGIIHHEGGAAKFLYHPQYDFSPALGCSWHRLDQNISLVSKCANSISQRRVYNALFYLCHLFWRKLHRPSHAPEPTYRR